MYFCVENRAESWVESGCAFVRWVQPPTADAVRSLNDQFDAVFSDPEPIVYMARVESTPRFPDQETRRLMAESVTRYPFLRIAVLFEEQGFVASIIRSVNTAIMQLSGGSVPQRMFSKPELAIAWLEEARAGSGSVFREFLRRADESALQPRKE